MSLPTPGLSSSPNSGYHPPVLQPQLIATINELLPIAVNDTERPGFGIHLDATARKVRRRSLPSTGFHNVIRRSSTQQAAPGTAGRIDLTTTRDPQLQ